MTIAGMRRVRAALDADWHNLCEQHADRPAPASWRQGLDEFSDLTDWARHAADPDGPLGDALVGDALRAAQDGDREAGRAVLHLLEPRLTGLASRDVHHDLGDYVSTAWLRIMTHPVDARPNALLANLALDTLKELSRSYARQHRVPPPSLPCSQHAGDDLDASALLVAAASAGWLPRTSEPVLRSVYCDGLSGREAAQRHQTSPQMVRYRCSAGVKAMRAHSRELLQAA